MRYSHLSGSKVAAEIIFHDCDDCIAICVAALFVCLKTLQQRHRLFVSPSMAFPLYVSIKFVDLKAKLCGCFKIHHV